MFKSFAKRVREFISEPVSRPLNQIYELILREQMLSITQRQPNPLSRCGRKIFSQTDEDGITFEIIRRIGLDRAGTYAEFGVGNGLENNTLALAALGWRGFWVGGQNLAFNVPQSRKFTYFKVWITLDNIVQMAQQGLSFLNSNELDIISLDLDGNDIYFVDKLLTNNIKPKLFIVEYNAKFPPPIRFQIDYDPQHRWQRSDYFGASLSSFDELFRKFGYKLVCCNAHTGSNAFFVRIEFVDRFADVPADINQIYVEPRYHLHKSYGHRASPKVAEVILRD